MRNEALKKIVYEEVVVPSRNNLTLEAARADATDEQIQRDFDEADGIDTSLRLENFVSRKYNNVEITDLQRHLWACRFAGVTSRYVYVKTVPNLGGWGIIHHWNEVKGHYGKFQSPQICNRILTRQQFDTVNAERASRKLKPLIVLDGPNGLTDKEGIDLCRSMGQKSRRFFGSEAYWRKNQPTRENLEDDEFKTAKMLSDANRSVTRLVTPWIKLTPSARAFYRGFFARNVEDRRKFLEEYGLSNALEVMHAKLLDMDSTVHNGTRALYQLDLPHANALVCSCSTTQRVFLIWVPKKARSCMAADLTLSHGMNQQKCIGAA